MFSSSKELPNTDTMIIINLGTSPDFPFKTWDITFSESETFDSEMREMKWELESKTTIKRKRSVDRDARIHKV